MTGCKRAGQTYDEVTEGQLHAAKAVVVLWSSRSVRSKWVRAEATLGDRKSALIPVMIEQCDRPIMFELIQTADLIAWEGDTTAPAWRAFVADVRDHIERKTVASKPAAPGAAAPPLPPKGDAPGSAPASDSIEAAFWMSIADGDDREEFESYLERYPKGHFAVLARKRIAALDAPKAAPVAQAGVAPPPEPLKIPEPPTAEAGVRPVTPRPDAFQSKPTPSVPPAARKGGSAFPLVAGLAIVGSCGGFASGDPSARAACGCGACFGCCGARLCRLGRDACRQPGEDLSRLRDLPRNDAAGGRRIHDGFAPAGGRSSRVGGTTARGQGGALCDWPA